MSKIRKLQRGVLYNINNFPAKKLCRVHTHNNEYDEEVWIWATAQGEITRTKDNIRLVKVTFTDDTDIDWVKCASNITRDKDIPRTKDIERYGNINTENLTEYYCTGKLKTATVNKDLVKYI